MLALANVLDLFVHELACGRGRPLTGTKICSRATYGLLAWHVTSGER
jgi:hypothetical protein